MPDADTSTRPQGEEMQTMVLTTRRIDGRFLISYVTNADTGQQVVTTPVDFWRRRERPVEADYPFGGGASQIAKLAVAMIDARLTGCEPPTIPASMPCGDVIAAVRVVETLLDRAAAPTAAQD
jgi:hypothetical protein